MTPADIAKLRALCEAATPGPLEADEDHRGGYNIHAGWHSISREHEMLDDGAPSLMNQPEIAMAKRIEDARLFAAARTALPALLDECEALRRERDEALMEARLGNEISAKVNEAINRAGIHCALYYWEAIDQIVAERAGALAEVKKLRDQLGELTWVANGLKAAAAWKPSEVWREEVADEVAEAIAAFVMAEADERREVGLSYRAVSELAADIRSGAWRKETP